MLYSPYKPPPLSLKVNFHILTAANPVHLARPFKWLLQNLKFNSVFRLPSLPNI